jgi:hypothetical protein
MFDKITAEAAAIQTVFLSIFCHDCEWAKLAPMPIHACKLKAGLPALSFRARG